MRALQKLSGEVLWLVLAIVLALASPSHALAQQCDWSDTKQAVSDLGSSANDFAKQCGDELADPVYWGLTIFFAGGAIGDDIALSNGGNGQTQSNVITQFCRDAVNEIDNGTGKTLKDIIDKLPDSVKKTLTQALNDILGDTASTELSSIGNAFTCACNSITLNGLGEIGDIVGSCVQSVECQISNNNPDYCCPITPAIPTKIDCSMAPCASATDTNCTNGPALIFGPISSYTDGCNRVHDQNPYCVGDTCYSQDPNQPPNANPLYVCTCPIAMQYKLQYPGNGQNGYIQCTCPPGTTQHGDQCVCPDGKSTLSWNGGTVAGNCPLPPPPKPVCAPTCAAGQTVNFSDEANCQYTCQCPNGQVSAGGTCVTPCTGGEVMLEGGTCCKAAQATSCGVCCPDGMIPDATGASCVVKRIPINTQIKPNVPKPGQTFKPNLGKP